MSRLDMVLTSIGKKELMALSGLGFVAFLVVHLAGNMTMLAGAAAFNGYAAKLESLGPLVAVAESGMLAMALLHVIVGLSLILKNLQARDVRYEKKVSEGGRTLGSWTMWLTGPWILVFIVLHLVHFTIEHKFMGNEAPLSQLVSQRLADPIWAGYYILSMLIVGLHVSHGFWSAFQTLGAAPGRKGHLRDGAVLLGLVFGAGFSLLAFFVYYIRDLLT